MKAAYVERYGSADVIAVRDVPDPVVGSNEVLVRQMASTVTPADVAFRAADPFIVRFFAGLVRPKDPIPGGAKAGVLLVVDKPATVTCGRRAADAPGRDSVQRRCLRLGYGACHLLRPEDVGRQLVNA